MYIIGFLFGLFDICCGIYLLTVPNSVLLGIVIITSGLLFIYVTIGAHTAFQNKKEIEKNAKFLEKEIRSKAALTEFLALKLNLNIEENLKYVENIAKDFSEMEEGFPLMIINNLKLKDNIIKKGTFVYFKAYEPESQIVTVTFQNSTENVFILSKELKNGWAELHPLNDEEKR